MGVSSPTLELNYVPTTDVLVLDPAEHYNYRDSWRQMTSFTIKNIITIASGFNFSYDYRLPDNHIYIMIKRNGVQIGTTQTGDSTNYPNWTTLNQDIIGGFERYDIISFWTKIEIYPEDSWIRNASINGRQSPFIKN